MSKASTPPNKTTTQSAAPNTSAWSRGPPPAVSNPSSNVPSTASTPPPPPNGVSANESATGSTPVAIGAGGNSRKGSLMVGGNGDVMPRGNLAFGTVDSPNTLLSSSPAAPSTTGSHLADAVKSFGSIDAEANAAGASMIRPPRRTSGGANPATPTQKKQLDVHNVHSFFVGKPQHPAGSTPPAPMSPSQAASGLPAQDRRQSGGQFPGANGMPAYQQMPGMGAQAHLRPMSGMPGGQRSPVMGGAPQPQFPAGQMPPGQPGGYRVAQPQMQGNQAARPNGPMMSGRPPMQIPYGMPPGTQPYVMYGQGGGYYYAPYGGNEQPPYWQPQHAPNMPLSPRQPQAQLHGSPAPPNATLPASGGGSPLPTPASRPQSLGGAPQSGSPMPSTPSRPLQPAAPFTPSTPVASAQPGGLSLSASASTFTPRARSTIKISRPDGTSVNLLEEAAAAKGPTSSSTSGVATPEMASDEPAKPQKKLPTALPVIVRMETEEQKRQRLEEEARIAKMKEQERKEEAERKERQERRAKEEAEAKAKEEADLKSKADDAATAKEVADTKAKENADKAKEQAEASIKEDAEAKKEEVKSEEVVVESPKLEQPETPKTEESAITTPAGDKADELRRAILTPTTQSAAASPLASPALAAAGLPAKPVAAIGSTAARRPTPSLDAAKAGTASPAASTSAGPSALSKAKAIEDLASVSYPTAVKPINSDLNVNGEPGKFRYDREFLMQFMKVCKEKPDTLPPLEEIGLEAGDSSSFGSGARRGGARPSMGQGRLGSMNSGRSLSANPMAMGQFAMGNIRNTTSEDRYQRSLQNSNNRMARTSSHGNNLPPMHGLPSMGHSSSRRGHGRDSNRGRQRQPPPSVNDPDVAPLVATANAWSGNRPSGAAVDEKSPAYIERKVKALLNKLTEEKFDSISRQILEWANKSRDEENGMTLKLVIKLVFEKATDEAHWSAMYAKLCRKLLEELDPAVSETIDGRVYSGGSLFRKYLLGRCQTDFESGWKAREEAALAALAKSDEDKKQLAKAEEDKKKASEGGEEAPAVMMSDEYYALQKAKRRGLGLIQLIGELYKLEMLSKSVIRDCLIRLLSNVENPDEEDLESTCKLITTVGRQFQAASPQSMDVVFDRLHELLQLESISSRIRFMIMDVVDLRKNKWRSRKDVVPTTIAQIHQQAARENAEKAQAAQQSISRGGSRTGHSRREGPGPQPGEWQSVATGPRPPQRPTDFSNLGRGVSSTLSGGPTFGPSSVFARGKKGSATGATPPISRQNSSANMFAMLNEADASTEPSEPAPQRKKLQLKPRTKPVDRESEGEADHSDEEAAEEETPAEEATTESMTDEAAKARIDLDTKELWGEKDSGGSRSPDDIVEYYRALPAEHKHKLSEKLIEDLFRIAKYRDAEIVAKGWAAALKAEVVSGEDLKKGMTERMVTLDDDAIDYPQAYKTIAVLMRSASLEQEEIDALLEKVEVYGEPRVTPKMKLDKAFGQLDEELSA